MNIESIKAKLKQYSKANKKVHQYTLTRYFQERFLYRLSQSNFKDRFLLKGGALVYVLGAEASRYTKDIDFLLTGKGAVDADLASILNEVCQIKVEDGLEFDLDSIATESIQKDGQNEGTRIKIKTSLGNIIQQLQIDVGIGDFVTPGPQQIIYPTLLEGLAKPVLQAYSLETLVAEKFEAMIALGEYNSRFKDFYDIYTLVENCDMSVLSKAIQNTLKRRETTISKPHPIFEKTFYSNPQRLKQWNVFLTRSELGEITFEDVYEKLKRFLKPIYEEMLG
ncbi:MAG: nucleotidyl transferase AbiEii/AbiGii toxin family protein [Bacteroidia bacterium]